MTGCYSVSCGMDSVGKVQVEKIGLYYRFQCRCRAACESVYRLMAQFGLEQIPVGVLVPDGVGIHLDKRIPVKVFPKGTPDFLMVPLHPDMDSFFVPLSPEEPFAYLTRLKDSFLTEQNGVIGLMIKNGKSRE